MMGSEDRALQYLDRALEAYLDSAGHGEVHYWHHLADFYSDVCPDGAEAVKWARKDVELRSNFNTQAAMGLALHVAGCSAEGVGWIDRALESGVQDAHVFSQAARVYRGAGRDVEAEEFERSATRINPHAGRFHVHR